MLSRKPCPERLAGRKTVALVTGCLRPDLHDLSLVRVIVEQRDTHVAIQPDICLRRSFAILT